MRGRAPGRLVAKADQRAENAPQRRGLLPWGRLKGQGAQFPVQSVGVVETTGRLEPAAEFLNNGTPMHLKVPGFQVILNAEVVLQVSGNSDAFGVVEAVG